MKLEPEQGRILVADDDDAFREAISELLHGQGYRCESVPDGDQALEKLRNEEYDLLSADIKMEGNSELEVIRALPRIAEGMPVILITGYPSLKSAIESIHLPVKAYLTKPFEFKELLSQARAAIDSYRVYRATVSLQQRLGQWSEDLKGIGALQGSRVQSHLPTPVDAFIGLTFQNISGALMDVRHLTESVSQRTPGHEVCHLLNCPRLSALKEALAEAVDTPERTKRAFKSKELGDLRTRFENLLKDLSS